jgi:drug/metabolite transporter superfamily protein YnfA
MRGTTESRFESAAAKQRDGSVLVELWLFLRDNKKWWLLPILAVLVLFGLLMLLAGTGAAPFIYTLF